MRNETIHLKTVFPQLDQISDDPTLVCYLQDNMTEIGRDDQMRPCLLICPGGGYEFCSEREGEPVALNFLPSGFNVFVLYYSTASYHFPVQLREVAAAMEIIYQNAQAWKCDVERIAIMGFSAGGHLAAHYTNCFDWPEVRTAFPESKGVNTSILCYPVISAEAKVAHLGSFYNLLGHENLTQEEVERFSCQNHVTEKTPPTFLWHTAPDSCVPVANSLLYANALAENHVNFSLHIYPFGGHGLATVDDQTNNALDDGAFLAYDWLDAAKKWLMTIFAKR